MAKKKIKMPKAKKAKKIFKKKMEVVMKEGKKGTLNIGKSKKKARSRKQIIAIALSEAKSAAKRGSVKKPKKNVQKSGSKKKKSVKKLGKKK